MTGTPGTGKTTFSRLLSASLGATHVDLSAYALEHGYAEVRDGDRDTAVVDLAALKAGVRGLLEDGEDCVLDGHYAHDVAPPRRTRIVFVLRRAPWLLHGELTARGYGAGKVWENVEAEMMGVCLSEAIDRFGPGRVYAIDTSASPPEATLEMGLAALGGGCRGDEVDWLGRPETLELLRGRTCT